MDGERRVDVLVIGAGQAGLAAAYHLRRAGADVLVVDGARRVGDSWRQRWDSLRLFTPLPFATLPGRGYPAGTPDLPGKDDVADYLEDYAAHVAVPLLLGNRVVRLADRFTALLQDGATLQARRVVIATGPYATAGCGSAP